jgi:peptidoglycan/xylan/chitin deacetylase (PgdA/CDA1 family)
MLSDLEDFSKDSGFRFTFFVTASLLKYHRDLIAQLSALGHEVAVHGQYHIRLNAHDLEVQRLHVLESHESFKQAGFHVTGFRCPYLAFNEDTLAALKESEYSWTSGKVLLFSESFSDIDGLDRLGSLYHVTRYAACSLPEYCGGVLELPVTAPDDEMLLERQRVRDPLNMVHRWTDLLERASQTGEFYHLFFHPERFDLVNGALKDVIQTAREMKIWTTTLGDLAAWWHSRREISWRVENSATPKLWVSTAAGLSILVKDNSLAQAGFIGGHRPADKVQDCDSEQCYLAGVDGVQFTVGLNPNSDASVAEFLVNEGFFVVRAESPGRHSLYLDWKDPLDEDGKRLIMERIRSHDRPLLRVWRWPENCRSAMAISADVCAINLRDFIDRSRHF